MTLYLPRAFDERDLTRLDALAASHPFATLITVSNGAPCVSHVPVLYRRDGERVELVGHIARGNPQLRNADSALAILHGPHAYVSPTWYPDKAAQARVPTWNYVVAHLSGPLEWFDDDASLGDVVGALADRHEARTGNGWRFNMGDPAERVQLRGIAGFRLVADRIEFKAKLSQNHPDANRHAVIEQLSSSDAQRDREVAAWMYALSTPAPEGN